METIMQMIFDVKIPYKKKQLFSLDKLRNTQMYNVQQQQDAMIYLMHSHETNSDI